MDQYPIETIVPTEAFQSLAEIPQPASKLYLRGTLEGCKGKKILAVVGSRKCTTYGKSVCKKLIEGLRGYPIVIASGLALGIDGVAHAAAIENELTTIALPGSGLSWKALYPAQHKGLAESILAAGGALISEYDPDMRAALWSFPKRNRIMAGIADMTLVIEAEEKSGTLITARLSTEYNKIVAAVPGPITSSSSKGTNWLLRLGAVPITESDDILTELGFTPEVREESAFVTEEESLILSLLSEPRTKDEIIAELGLDPRHANILFSSLEIKELIQETLGMVERIA